MLCFHSEGAAFVVVIAKTVWSTTDLMLQQPWRAQLSKANKNNYCVSVLSNVIRESAGLPRGKSDLSLLCFICDWLPWFSSQLEEKICWCSVLNGELTTENLITFLSYFGLVHRL